jgi:hypothetical protein
MSDELRRAKVLAKVFVCTENAVEAAPSCEGIGSTARERQKEAGVAVGMLMTLPGVRREQYEQVNEKMFGKTPFSPEDAPAGLIMHSGGPSPDGWYVYDIWESKEDFQRFVEEKLMPAIQELGFPQAESEPQFFEIHDLVQVR